MKAETSNPPFADATLQALRDPEIVTLHERHFERLKAFFDRAISGRPFFLSGIGVQWTDSPHEANWEDWLPGALETLARERAPHARDRNVFRPLVLCWNPHGVHFIDEIFGAQVFVLQGGWQARTLPTPIGELRAPDLERSLTWREVRRFTRRFLELELDAVTLSLPTIASPLNIAINLYGAPIITALLMEPENARRDLRTITDTLCRIHRWYIESVPFDRMQPIAAAGRSQPRGHGQICGCSTQLLSPELYEEFIAPLDEEVLSVYPHGGLIHLCGDHARHIPAFSRMKSLRAVQMNHRAADDVAAYYRGLREDQMLYVNPYEKMSADRIIELTDGGNRTVVCAPPAAVRHLLSRADVGSGQF